MPAVSKQPGGAPPRPKKHTVRIVKPRGRSRVALISLGIAASAAVLFPIGWRYWQSDEDASPRQRTWTEWQTRWRCEDGHYFYAPGQTGPRTCIHIDCEQPAYPVARYTCTQHGPFEVNVLFDLDENERPKITRLRLIGDSWVSASEGVHCPRCGRRLEYTGDPLLSTTKSRSSPGG